MSVKHAISRGLELGRSVFHFNLLKPAAQVAAKFRGLRVRWGHSARTVQPRTFLPSRYRFYRLSLSGLAAQLQSRGFRRVFGAGSPRNRAVFLAFGLGVGFIEQQLEDDRLSTSTCEEIQALFNKKGRFQTPLKAFASGYKLEDYVIGKQIGKGCNAVVYEAVAPLAPPTPPENANSSLVELKASSVVGPPEAVLPRGRSVTGYPLAVKMMWNIGAGSSSEDILRSMCQELVPAGPRAMKDEGGALSLDGRFGCAPRRVQPHPNVVTVYRAFTAEVPLLPGAREEYPDVLPSRFHPGGLGNSRTLFLVMKNYPCTLRQYLRESLPSSREGSLMVLQLLDGVDHLCRQGVAHRDLKSDNVLLEFDSGGCPRLVITDFGCCLADCDLQLPYSSHCVSRGGNASLMAPEVATAVPGPGVVIDYSKADAWVVGAIAYEIFGRPNPFYSSGPEGLDSRTYQEQQLPPLPCRVPRDTQLVIRLLLSRNPGKRPSARVASNMLHLSLWGGQALANQDRASMRKLADWLLCQSAVVLLKGLCPSGRTVEVELQRCFLANVSVVDLRCAVGYLLFGREQHKPQIEFV